MEAYSVKKSDFTTFLKNLSEERHTFYLKGEACGFEWKTVSRRRLWWQEYTGNFEGIIFGQVRAQDPLKQFIFSTKQKVSENFKGTEGDNARPLLLVGAKNCDLAGLSITDFVFMQNGFKDPFYIQRRENAFIIGNDCSCPIDTCFCVALGIQPFPEKNFDMSVSDIGDEYVIEVVSEKAKQYILQYQMQCMPVTDEQLCRRQAQRDEARRGIEINIKNHAIPRKESLSGIMEKGFDSRVWQDEIETCVECGCCNFICPTCHCFFLSDSQKNNTTMRHKIWDACLYKDFAVVAGGANPRKRLAQRLRNRYEKKFDYFPSVAGMIACTGCGRCISGCPAKIDIRRILKNLVAEASSDSNSKPL